MADIEIMAVDWLSHADELQGIPVSLSVGEPRRDRFVTVEQTGATLEHHLATATLAVQVWDTSRAKASRLANEVVAPVLLDMWQVDEVGSVEILGIANMPDPGPPFRHRYQISAHVTAAA
ncbi:hypothetical protein CRD60_00925 [Bifidobacterium aemilianum]|uniref:Uncharacterized protein n=1 Tax=Bifidobacterium aemilianum TaxID=2493120 RepID=A0A366K9N8_9BIFI|nr:hypothetical protein [Bifidobacterium aemilianum]RBP98460.1 hypothetical protein CRD60_00925 [Bifidobacterium aemilianum]